MTHAGFYVAAHRRGSEQRLRFQDSFFFFPASEHAAGGSQTGVVVCNLVRLRKRHQTGKLNIFGQI